MMGVENYQCCISVPITIKQAFDIIKTKAAEWWPGSFGGICKDLDDTFTIDLGKDRLTLHMAGLIPRKRIIWRASEGFIPKHQNKNSLGDTKIIWQFASVGNATVITMTHIGLMPQINHYEKIAGQWETVLNEDLYHFMTKPRVLKPDHVIVGEMALAV